MPLPSTPARGGVRRLAAVVVTVLGLALVATPAAAAATGGTITTIAGTGVRGYSGDGGPATQAQLDIPVQLVVAPDGGVLFLDSNNQRVRRIAPDGVITTVVGTGTSGFSGDGGPATQAQLASPNGLALGPDGSLFIGDTFNYRVRRVSPDGVITTVAGTGVSGFSGDGGPATAAQLTFVRDLDVAADGSLVLSDDSRIRRISPAGIISTVAGSAARSYSGDGGPATAATLNQPFAVKFAADGAILLADTFNHRVRRIGPDGVINTIVGTGTAGYSGDGGPATAAQLDTPTGLGPGPGGSFLVTANHNVRQVATDGTITTLAGGAGAGFTGDGGPATAARLSQPRDAAVTADGGIVIADYTNYRVRRVTPVVNNTAPTATDDAYTTAEDTALTVAAPGVLGNDTDPDRDALTAALVTGPAHGTATVNANGAFTYTPAENFNGTDTFTYTASDASGPSAPATVTITVTPVNDPPVAVADAYTTAQGTPLTIPAPGVLANDSDPDGDPLGATPPRVSTGPNPAGTLTLNPDGSFTFTPNAGFVGDATFPYQAFDGTSRSAGSTITITVTGTRNAPVAVDDAYSTGAGRALTVAAPGVLGNDTDADGDALTAAAVTAPAHGTATLNADGSFTYTPAAGFAGTDSFTYRAKDATSSSNVATVTLTVTAGTAAPPTVKVVGYGACAATGAAGTVRLALADPDTNPTALTLTARSSDQTLLPDSGLTAAGTGADRTLTVTPRELRSGQATVTVTVSDGARTATATLRAAVGTDGRDTLSGTPGPDLLLGKGGNDVLSGAAGEDVVCGGDGDDLLLGGNGNDTLDGGNGADRMSGDAGNDVLRGGPGTDVLFGGAGADAYSGGPDRDLNLGFNAREGDTTDNT